MGGLKLAWCAAAAVVVFISVDRLVDGLVGWGHVEGRVRHEKVGGLHHESRRFDRHDGEVFDAGQVRDRKRKPDDDISVHDT